MKRNDPEPKDCCGICRFGKVSKDDVRSVDCFRYPAQVISVLVQDPSGRPTPAYLNATPTMEGNDWCGEFQPRRGTVQ